MASDGNRRGPWSQSEDRRLLQCIKEDGPQNWVAIAHEVGGRSAKQCRERYHQNLKPGLNHSPISEAEADYILQQVEIRGPRWAEISRELNNNRSDNAVKNWWNGYMNRTKRLRAREEAASTNRPSTSDAQHRSLTFLGTSRHSGPAPLPSPTETGFSPRTREAPFGWPRDPLPPSPSSVASDQSATSRTRLENYLPRPQARYYAPPTDTWPSLPRSHGRVRAESRSEARISPMNQRLRSPTEPTRPWNWVWNEYEYGPPQGSWGTSTSPGESRDSSTDPSGSYDIPRSELRPPHGRLFYHSHQLPLHQNPRQLEASDVNRQDEARAFMAGVENHAEVNPPRVRDERMSVSALMD